MEDTIKSINDALTNPLSDEQVERINEKVERAHDKFQEQLKHTIPSQSDLNKVYER